jgi:hypothetical protein
MSRALPFCFVLLACAGSRSQKAPPRMDGPASQAASAPTADAPKVRGKACSVLLQAERALPQQEQLVPAHDKVLLAALSHCERYLLDRGGKKLRDATGEALPLYSLAEDALAGLPAQEVQSYVALLNRFALVGDLRRQLHYGPRLRTWFDRIAQKDCSDLSREAALYFSTTPESLGGDVALAKRLTERCGAR